MRGELRIVDDVPAAFCEHFADAWAARGHGPFTVALSGGDTARRCYERLATWGASPVDWSQVVVLWGDERCVPLGHPESNHRLAREALLDHVGPVAAAHPMSCDDPDGYDHLVRSVPAIDLVHLGLGPDAHTASLFPGSPALDAPPDRLVVPNEDPLGNNPHPRLTLTFAGIARGRRVVVTVEGASKRQALDRVRAGEPVPGALADGPGVVWLVDREAAAP